MTNKTSVVAVICEDIREEKTGTVTIVGVMPDNAELPRFPATIPKVGIHVRIQIDPTSEVVPIAGKVVMPDDTEISMGEIDVALIRNSFEDSKAKGNPLSIFLVNGLLSPLHVPKPGRMRVIAKVGNEEFIAGFINFVEAPVATKV